MVQRYATQPQHNQPHRNTKDVVRLLTRCYRFWLMVPSAAAAVVVVVAAAILCCAVQPHVAQRKALTPSATSSPWSEGWAEAWQEEAGMSTHRRAVRLGLTYRPHRTTQPLAALHVSLSSDGLAPPVCGQSLPLLTHPWSRSPDPHTQSTCCVCSFLRYVCAVHCCIHVGPSLQPA
eukprot:COSAG06_NODE_5156_length_3675_cov_1.665548_3_plen_176_part_00